MSAFQPLAAFVLSDRLSAHEGKKTMHSLTAYIVERSWCTDSKQTHTQKHTLHVVLCAKPLLPEGTLALMFG